jgi:hypothetical protein
MEDVLSFLDDWGEDEKDATPQDSGIVSIGDDIMMEANIEEPEKLIQNQNLVTQQDFLVYEGEVPPIPLDDVEALEITSEQPPVATESVEQQQLQTAQTDSLTEEGVPNFDSFSADEYDDTDMDLSEEDEEDAILEALSDLGYKADIEEKKKKKKK